MDKLRQLGFTEDEFDDDELKVIENLEELILQRDKISEEIEKVKELKKRLKEKEKKLNEDINSKFVSYSFSGDHHFMVINTEKNKSLIENTCNNKQLKFKLNDFTGITDYYHAIYSHLINYLKECKISTIKKFINEY